MFCILIEHLLNNCQSIYKTTTKKRFCFCFIDTWDPPRNGSHSRLNKAGDTLAAGVRVSAALGVCFYFGSHVKRLEFAHCLRETRVSGAARATRKTRAC